MPAAALGAALAVLAPAGAASAAASTSTYDAPVTACQVTDKRVPEISGAVETATGWLVVNDKSEDVWALDADCAVTRYWKSDRKKKKVSDVDVEDLMTGPDGTLWLADTGGNRLVRQVVHLVGLTTAREVIRVDLQLPAKGLDIEAAAGHPALRARAADQGGRRRRGGAHRAAAHRGHDHADPAARCAARWTSARSPAFLPAPGLSMTGAALSPDGAHIALRTYTDVFEVDATDAPVVDALMTHTPHWVARVPQPQGEAITYGPPGESRLSLLSEGLDAPVRVVGIHRANTDATSFPAPPRWPLYAGLAVLLFGAAAFRGARLLRRRLDGSIVIGAVVLAIGLAGTGLAVGLRSPGYRSVAVISLAPRDPVGIGADALELLGPRYVALLDDPGLVARAGDLVGRADLDRAAEVKAAIEPGTINLEIAVVSGSADLSSRVANALAGLVQDLASTDPLVYGRRSASAQPAEGRELPSASQLAVFGAGLVGRRGARGRTHLGPPATSRATHIPRQVAGKKEHDMRTIRAAAAALITCLGASLLVATVEAPAQTAPSASSTSPESDSLLTAEPMPTWQTNGAVYAVAVVGNVAYVGGNFTAVRPPGAAPGTGEVARKNLAAFDATTGALLPFSHSFWSRDYAIPANGVYDKTCSKGVAPNTYTCDTVYEIRPSADGSQIFVGGDFEKIDDKFRTHHRLVQDRRRHPLDVPRLGHRRPGPRPDGPREHRLHRRRLQPRRRPGPGAGRRGRRHGRHGAAAEDHRGRPGHRAGDLRRWRAPAGRR